MPDASGNFKGQGWSARKAAAWERIFNAGTVSGRVTVPIGRTGLVVGHARSRGMLWVRMDDTGRSELYFPTELRYDD